MRLFPAVDRAVARFPAAHKKILFAAVLMLAPAPALAQSQGSNSSLMDRYFNNSSGSSSSSGSSTSSAAAASAANTFMGPNGAQNAAPFISAMQGMMAQQQGGGTLPPGFVVPGQNPLVQQPAQPADLGSATDPNSARYKANKLGLAAEKQRVDEAKLKEGGLSDDMWGQEPPPPDVMSLQNINEAQKGKKPDVADDPLDKEIALDMRKSAQMEAALSYGARGGLAKRNYEIMERMRGFDKVLDGVFNFRALLIKAPSGLLIEPPIIKESADALVINEDGVEAAVADKIFDINKKAKIVSAPRDWRHYLIQSWSEVPPPPQVLWPRTPKEQADWSGWVQQGWVAGLDQADQMFESNVNRLVAEYNGMVRYRMLLAQGMISAPYAMHEDRGVVSDASQMRVGDRAIRITGPSQFLTKAELWKPADR